jgi:hypothetical protein
MKSIKGLSVLLALSLFGCGWFQSSSTPSGNGQGSVAATGTGTKGAPAQGVPAPACTCDDYPYPPGCASSCDVGEAKIVSIDPKAKTAVVTITRGAQVVQRTIALSSLPTGVPAEAGAKFAALYKKDVAKPENSRIVRFAARVP